MTLIETFADRAVALADRFVAFARANPFRLVGAAMLLSALVATGIVLATGQAQLAAMAQACLAAR
ncbi:MAG TPA: hypothetical protein PKG84_08710 [Novosphingobium sp.]|nr:hypothetical protein [Novosphingobium sp.]